MDAWCSIIELLGGPICMSNWSHIGRYLPLKEERFSLQNLNKPKYKDEELGGSTVGDKSYNFDVNEMLSDPAP